MAANPEFASFLIARRAQIEAVMSSRLGPAAPGPGSPESEVLRRFRSFAASALRRGEMAQPALDGLRANERRTTALLESWTAAAVEVAGSGGDGLHGALDPLLASFRNALKQTHTTRRSKGAPRTKRRAVTAAIDRIADAFLALDTDEGRIADANPAAGALLGVSRDALLGVEAQSFIPEPLRAGWWVELDSIAEGTEPRRFESAFRDVADREIRVDCSLTRFARRERPLALLLARPR